MVEGAGLHVEEGSLGYKQRDLHTKRSKGDLGSVPESASTSKDLDHTNDDNRSPVRDRSIKPDPARGKELHRVLRQGQHL